MPLSLACILLHSAVFSTVHGMGVNESGKQLYTSNCSNCHGLQGEGFMTLYPPIRKSRFLKDDIANLPCLIRHGLKGKIEIDGKVFNQIMPPNNRLSAENISLIIEYMQDAWEHDKKAIKTAHWLQDCANTTHHKMETP